MWARAVEIMLGLWLAISPAIFRGGEAEAALWATDLAVATWVIVCACLSCWLPLRHAHLAILAASGFLIAIAYLETGAPESATAQNHLMLGLLLAMFAIVPNYADEPPMRWRRYAARLEQAQS
ncbi:hypothetical protein Mal64_05120 [Pseudobythopirellula maris]|uniref:SPW repeat-containing integral membrane domain-containing protein n=1 Tax=Pseudobythopirellula maris TaxID=2527991 RepID=A0A5C5ZRJ1_9BACT|nr:hypothetical protein [Pseudobythopirellula maris]TWT90129.1 hypothetical protein Mal64_05120 [Pseudobythopirellula maris]